MPFNSENAAAFGSKGGKATRAARDPESIRSKSLVVKVTPPEYDFIRDKAVECGISKAELIVRAISVYMVVDAHDKGHN